MNLTFASQHSALFSTGMEKSGDMYINRFNRLVIMQMIRNMNIVILAFLLILTGCFGLADDSVSDDAEGQTATGDGTTTPSTTDVNNPPFISDNSILNNLELTLHDDQMTIDTATGEEILVGFWYNLYHAVLDIDGDSITAGWDTDLDGTIDTATTNASGFTLVYVPIENFHTLDNEYDSDVSIATVAFIAQDEHGLGSVIFVDVIGSDDYLNDDDDGGLMLYVFSGTDAPDRTLADGSTDKGAVIVTMTQGSDLGWASITIKASVDGAASVTVPMCDATTEINCWESADSDTTNWNVGEAVTVDTSCDGTCVVEVTILNSREGVTLDTSTIDSE